VTTALAIGMKYLRAFHSLLSDCYEQACFIYIMFTIASVNVLQATGIFERFLIDMPLLSGPSWLLSSGILTA
jgi:hypothetical protein